MQSFCAFEKALRCSLSVWLTGAGQGSYMILRGLELLPVAGVNNCPAPIDLSADGNGPQITLVCLLQNSMHAIHMLHSCLARAD